MNSNESEIRNEDLSEEEIGSNLMACTFNVGSHTFSIPLQYVKEITEVSEILPLPLTPPHIEGIVHLRGSAIPVVNMGTIEDVVEEKQKVKQLIVLDFNNETFGIVTNEIPDLNAKFAGELINVKKFYETYRIAK